MTRPDEATIVVTRSRASALTQLLICLAIVAAFYWALLGDVAGHDAPLRDSIDSLWHARWLLLIVPVLLLPYLFDNAKVLLRGERFVFNAATRELRTIDRGTFGFDQIESMELRAVNGGCEEFTLSVRLHDGAAIALMTDDASARIVNLSNEIASLIGVRVSTL